MYLSSRRKVRKTHTTVIFDDACVSGYRVPMCGCTFRKGGKVPSAHAPTWASIRAVHATLSLSFVAHTHARAHTYTHAHAHARTRTHIHSHTAYGHAHIRAHCFAHIHVRTFAHVYLGTRKHFAFVMLMEARFDGWINAVHPGDISSKLYIVHYILRNLFDATFHIYVLRMYFFYVFVTNFK